MNTTYRLTDSAADAFKQGRMTQHRIPAPAGEAPPLDAGAVIELVQPAPYGKTISLGRVRVLSIERERLEDLATTTFKPAAMPTGRFSLRTGR